MVMTVTPERTVEARAILDCYPVPITLKELFTLLVHRSFPSYSYSIEISREHNLTHTNNLCVKCMVLFEGSALRAVESSFNQASTDTAYLGLSLLLIKNV